MRKEKRISGSVFAKIVVFFVLAISSIIGIAAVGGVLIMLNTNAYNYQAQEKCVQVVAREMMVEYAWLDMHVLRDEYSTDDEEGLKKRCQGKNYTVEFYEGDKLIWSNYEGEETPYSFRYSYSQLKQNVAKDYTVLLYVNPDFPEDDEYLAVYNRAVILCEGRFIYPIVAGICVLLMLICFLFLMCGAGHKNGREGITPGPLTAIHFDVLAVFFGMVAFFGFLILYHLLVYEFDYDVLFQFGAAALLGGAVVVWCTIFCVDFAIRLKLGGWWKHTLIAAVLRLIGRICRFCKNAFITLIKGLPIIATSVIAYLALCLAEFIGLCIWGRSTELVVVWFFEKLILLPVVMYFSLVCKKLQEGSKSLAEGDLNFKIDTTKMILDFKEHGENLNQIGEGISKAVAERMKSEHLKTELITNVSHDLKTPLTSIINYADLLQYEAQKLEMGLDTGNDLKDDTGEAKKQNAKIAEYAEVLHRQSKRLKKLLEDLVEASKATTGALEVNLVQCEIGVLLSQAVGEYEQRFAEKQLNLIVHQPEEPVRIMADGRHLWRVFDNLLNNICKYAQENTRVYLTVDNKEGQVAIIFRNMSKYALDISGEELEERFVRGDKSRHMEGNGLGLSIAKSLVELQNGHMEIVTDGDLFKVTLYFKEI